MIDFLVNPDDVQNVLGPFLTLLRILAFFGGSALILATARHYWESTRWQWFKRGMNDWISKFDDEADVHPKMMSETDWKALVEVVMSESRFRPTEIQSLLEMAVATAKRTVADQIYMDTEA